EYRGEANKHLRNGALLSKARWLFMAQFRDRFPQKVLAEMRGVFDENNISPFWESLGKHFFPMDFNEADRLTGLGQKSFIGELMPKFPIYTTFMSEEARACIGQVHRHTRPALEMLKKEGLRWEGYIDIFDGGPTVEAYIDDVRAIRNSQLYQVEVSASAPQESVSRWLAASTQMLNFTASWIGRGPADSSTIVLTPDEAERLGVSTGDAVRLLET
ncbi:MAG TPA: arginine N-succinyltransferase, partial [Halomonas sp.]|nr:arginine N-succinyltransferase [Halomonas sp.]